MGIKEEQPFAVLNFDTAGLDTLMTELAKAKILVQSCGTSMREALAVAPYWWGCNSDPDGQGQLGGGDRQAARGQEGAVRR